MSALDSLKENWQERPLSEKRILSLLAAIVVVSMFYLLVFDPLVSWREQEKKRLRANQNVYAQVSRLVNRFEQQQAAPEEQSDGLAGIIDKSLQENGLSMRGFQPGKNNDARLRLSDVPYQSLTQWLYDLEYRYNIAVEELSIAQTKQQGLLIASVRVRKN